MLVDQLPKLEFLREPFSTSPDPSFFYKSLDHYAALNKLEIGIRLRRGLSVILGDVGTGKTTLLRALLQNFSQEEDRYMFHLILDPSFVDEKDFLEHLARIFGINMTSQNAMAYKERIEKHLYKRCVDESKVIVLIIDEGQKLLPAQLEALRTLLNYETNEYKLLQLVIFSQMELLPRIHRMKNFFDRISTKYIIHALNEYETKQLIDFRLKQAGYLSERSLFTDEAIARVYHYTRGYPRQIARICHNAVNRLMVGESDRVTDNLIERVIADDKAWK